MSWLTLCASLSPFIVFREQDSDDEPETTNQKVEENLDEVCIEICRRVGGKWLH